MNCTRGEGAVEWLVVLSSVLVAILYGYTKLTMPTGRYGELPTGPLRGGRGVLIGAVWGACVVLWLLDSAAPSETARLQRQEDRKEAVRKVDQLAAQVVSELEAKREEELKARHQKKIDDEVRRAEESRRAKRATEAKPEELGTVQLPAALKGPCMELQGCVCGMARQFHDNFILARRYRKWCRDVPRLRGEWACKGQLEIVAEDLRRNQFLLAEKGLSFPVVCPLDRNTP